MPRLRGIEGGGQGGLDPRRARLSRIHDASILGLAASIGGFLVVAFFFTFLGQWGPTTGFWVRFALATLGASAVMCVVTIYTVALLIASDPRTIHERSRLDDEEE